MPQVRERGPVTAAQRFGLGLRWEFDACVHELRRLRSPSDRPLVSSSVAVVATVVAVLWGNAVVWVGRRCVWDPEWITLIAVPSFGAAFVVLLRIQGWSWETLGARRPVAPDRRWPALLLAVWAVAMAGAATLWLVTGNAQDRLETVRILIGTAFGEELVFRSAVLAIWLAAPVRLRVVVVANMVGFAAWHIVGAWKPDGFHPLEVLGPVLLAVPLLWARLRFHSVLASTTLHAVNIAGVGS